jgi:hypothetical protein
MEKEFTDLNDDELYTLLLNTDFKTIISLCETTKRINYICHNDYFWKTKLYYDFGNYNQLINETWKQSYILLNQAYFYFDKIVYGYNINYDFNNTNEFKNNILLDIIIDGPIKLTFWFNREKQRLMISIFNIVIFLPRRHDEAERRMDRHIITYILTEKEIVNFIYIFLNKGVKPKIDSF